MPNWKKVVVSGSNVSQLVNDGIYLRTIGDGVISSSAQIAAQISGAFTATSASLSGRIDNLSSSSTVFASTGSNTFKGDQTFSGSLLPETTEVFKLGSPDKVWESLYVDGQSIYMRDAATNTFVTMSANAGVLTFNNTRLNVPLGITSSNLILTSVVNAGVNTGKFLVLDTNGNVDFRTEAEVLSDIGAQGLSAGTVSSSAQIVQYGIFATTSSNTFQGNQQVTGSVNATSFTGSLLGTASLATAAARASTVSVSGINTDASYTFPLIVTGSSGPSIGLNIDTTNVGIVYNPSTNLFRVTNISATGSLFGTSSWAENSLTASNISPALINSNIVSSSTQIQAYDIFLEKLGDSVISSSAQIAGEISGAFGEASGGFSTRVTALEAAGGTAFSSSVASRLTSVEGYTLDNVTDNGSTTTNGITVGGLTVNGNATITGTLTAQQFNTEYVSSSIIFESGSTKFGDSVDDVHSFTGSVKLNTETAATTDTDKFLVFDTGGQIKYRTGAEVLSDINPGGLISSSAQLTTEFDTRYLNTTGDNVISSSAQVTISSTTGYTTFSSSIASDIAALQGAGYVDVGTGASGSLGGTQRIALWEDTNTIGGDSTFTYDNQGIFRISGGTIRRYGAVGWSTGTVTFSIGDPASCRGAFITYVIYSNDAGIASFRAGNVTAAWNAAGSSVVFNETTTATIGTIPTITTDVSLSSGNMYVKFTQSSGTLFNVQVNVDTLGV